MRLLRFSLLSVLLATLLAGAVGATVSRWSPWAELGHIHLDFDASFVCFRSDATTLLFANHDSGVINIAEFSALTGARVSNSRAVVEKKFTTTPTLLFGNSPHGPLLATSGLLLADRNLSVPPLVSDAHTALLQQKVSLNLLNVNVDEAYEGLSAFGLDIRGPVWLQDKVSVQADGEPLETAVNKLCTDLGLAPKSTHEGLQLISKHEAKYQQESIFTNEIVLWKLPEVELLHRLKLKGSVQSANFSADGRFLVGADEAKRRVWNTQSGEPVDVDPVTVLPVATEPIDKRPRVPFSDGRRVAKAVRPGSIQIVQGPEEQVLCTVGGTEDRPAPVVMNPFGNPNSPPEFYLGEPAVISPDDQLLTFFKSNTYDSNTHQRDMEWVVYQYRRPEYWWGAAWLPELWIAVVLALLLLGSMWRDRHLRRKKTAAG
jgi:hypothetical protein